MARFIMLTFGFLGWAFYEMSGGSEFEAGSYITAKSLDEAETPVVARADTSAGDLNSIAATRKPAPALDVTLATARITPAPQTTVAVVAPAPAQIEEVAAQLPKPEVAAEPATEVRRVTGTRVNVRNGPGTTYQVVTQLRRGDDVTILRDPGDGWVKLRVIDGNRVGWMSGKFLTVASN